MSRRGIQNQTGGERNGHDGEADFQREKIAAPLREFSGLPRGEDVNESKKRREREIVFVVETKPVTHEKVEVIEIKNHREGVQPFERETGKFDFLARGHGDFYHQVTKTPSLLFFVPSCLGG